MVAASPVKHEHPRVLPQRKLKEVRCWSAGCSRLIGLYDVETHTLFTRCKCGSWQPIDIANL